MRAVHVCPRVTSMYNCVRGCVCLLACLYSCVWGCTEQIAHYHVNMDIQIETGPLRVYYILIFN